MFLSKFEVLMILIEFRIQKLFLRICRSKVIEFQTMVDTPLGIGYLCKLKCSTIFAEVPGVF